MSDERVPLIKNNPEYGVEALRILSNIPGISVYITDFHTCEILACNGTYAQFCGADVESVVGTLCYKNLGYDSRCPFCKYEQLLDENGEPAPPCSWEQHFEEYGMTLQIINRALKWTDGRLANMGVGVDVTRRKQMENELHRLAFFDQVLQIPNHEHMKVDMEDNRYHCYMIAVKLPNIEQINNVFGRESGDTVLRMVRDYILDLKIRDSELYRGKICDFCILFERPIENEELPLLIAEEIYERCRKPWESLVDGRPQNMLMSANVCVLSLDFSHKHFFSYLYNLISYALNISQKKESVVVCDDAFRAKFDSGIKLELSLKSAVQDGMAGFAVAYQPIVDIRKSAWKGFESLCRWNSPEFGMVPPDVFIPAAEACGLINSIGMWVLEQSIIQVKRWGLDKNEDFLLEVNISPIQLAASNLDGSIMEILRRHDFPPEKLGLEITESNELNFSKPTMEVIEKLSMMGVSIILDDFGTGYSSFATLHKLPAKILKTDRSLINGMETDTYLQNLVRVMVEIAHCSGMRLVAEGVETESQARFMLEEGVDFIQGYYYSRPLFPEQMEDKLDNFRAMAESL